MNQNEVVHQHKPLTEEERIAFRQLQKASKGEPWLAENKQKSSAIALGDQEQGDEQKGAGGSTGSESKVVSSTKSVDDAEFKNDRGQCRIDERRRNTEDNRKSPVDDSSRSGAGPSKSGRRGRSDPREAVTQFAELLFAFFCLCLLSMSTNGYIVISLKRLKVTTRSDGQTKFRRRISVAPPSCTVIGESKPN